MAALGPKIKVLSVSLLADEIPVTPSQKYNVLIIEIELTSQLI